MIIPEPLLMSVPPHTEGQQKYWGLFMQRVGDLFLDPNRINRSKSKIGTPEFAKTPISASGFRAWGLGLGFRWSWVGLMVCNLAA